MILKNKINFKENKTNDKENIHIVGFGWACVGFLQNINTEKYNIYVISNNSQFSYTPLLAQNIKQNKKLVFSLTEINNRAILHKTEVDIINFNEKNIVTQKNETIPYHHLILSHGSTVNTFNISGVDKNTFFIKTYEDSQLIKRKLLSLNENAKIVVIGCGLTGSEIIGSLIDLNKFKITAIDALPLPLPTFDPTISNKVIQLWKKNNVDMRFNKCVSKITDKSVEFKEEDKNVPYDLAIWCAGIKPTTLTAKINTILKLNCNKGIPVNKYLQVENAEDVYAMGDCAFTGLPPTAQVAYQQGKYLANQFNHKLTNPNIKTNTIIKSNEFVFENKGQFCYIGKNKSVFQNKYLKSGGNIAYYLNNVLHSYYLYGLYKK